MAFPHKNDPCRAISAGVFLYEAGFSLAAGYVGPQAARPAGGQEGFARFGGGDAGPAPPTGILHQ